MSGAEANAYQRRTCRLINPLIPSLAVIRHIIYSIYGGSLSGQEWAKLRVEVVQCKQVAAVIAEQREDGSWGRSEG
ncbi:MAG TPA: hypothetical protein GXX29_04250 [Firmicutes bacterium]|nr:hypothetical protein [Bacillota bacterium]